MIASISSSVRPNSGMTLSGLCRRGVAILTLQNVERGGKMQNYDKAKQVSEATGGKVSIKDLCEG